MDDCKSRYFNVLDTSIKNEQFTIEEDIFVIEKIKEIGKNWIEISKSLPGKSPEFIRQRYLTTLKNVMNKNDDNDSVDDSSSSDSDSDDDKPDDNVKQFVFNPLLRESD